MTVAEILEELPTLKAEERQMIWDRLSELETKDDEETPEMLAAIDEAEKSPRSEYLTVKQVRANIHPWIDSK